MQNNNNNNNNPFLVVPPPAPDNNGWIAEPDPADPDAAAIANWRERERRQRTVRVLMMFLFMLLLMDDDEQQNARNRNNNQNNNKLRGRGGNNERTTTALSVLEPDVFTKRRQQDENIQEISRLHTRYQHLMERQLHDHASDIQQEILDWAYQQANLEIDEFFHENQGGSESKPADLPMEKEDDDTLKNTKVWHYPWNSTGFYRGEWTTNPPSNPDGTTTDTTLIPATTRTSLSPTLISDSVKNTTSKSLQDKDVSTTGRSRILTAPELEQEMLWQLQQQQQQHIDTNNESSSASSPPPSPQMQVLLVPDNYILEMRDDNNLTSTQYDERRVDANGKILDNNNSNKNNNKKKATSSTDPSKTPPKVTLERNDGRAAFQLVSRNVPGMIEMSIVDGFCKLYDSTSPGYSTRKDILLRVKGVLFHSIGKLSLVANVPISQMALVLDKNQVSSGGDNNKKKNIVGAGASAGQKHRRLEEEHMDKGGLEEEEDDEFVSSTEDTGPTHQSKDVKIHNAGDGDDGELGTSGKDDDDGVHLPPWSDTVIPFPFVRDDKDETIRRTRSLSSRTMPIREQALEENAAGCTFEINMDVSEVEWTVGAWRKLLGRRVKEIKKLDPALQPKEDDEEDDNLNGNNKSNKQKQQRTIMTNRRRRAKPIQDQALVMNMVGTIHSPNCNFTAFLNTTALRTDWDATTSKAINYSFYMMLVCLTQILILLRQLLHSQAQSTATRVSLLCIGWQTIIDALLCLAHIYLSLAVQPLFSAFASVAFFKLLIFCVIEMKYMAIIIQARNSSNGGQPTDVLRRQVAMLHLRFYVTLLVTFLLLFYVSDRYRIYYMLSLYSFWVPQIILNIITEARNPMHKYYIYGMSFTRLVAPVYIFAFQKNFLKEVYPESPTDPFMCQAIILWVACQAAVLIAQNKYGARFMIPARFLPPKFDYSRPIPPSMLPPGALDLPTPELMEERDDDSLRGSARPPATEALISVDHRPPTQNSRHQTAETTRNRHKGSRLSQQASSGVMTTEDHTNRPSAPPAPTLECSICYDAIDVRDREKYMLAPCNHLFHRDCLAQWMDVKLECPICRTELPAL